MISLVFSFLVSSVFAANHNCVKGERVFFSCNVSKAGKALSICGSQEITESSGSIVYRFGLPKMIELEFPAKGKNWRKEFHYSRYTRPRFTWLKFKFKNDNVTYVLHDVQDSEGKKSIRSQSIGITVGSNKTKSIKCLGSVEGSLMGLEDFFELEQFDEE